MEPLRAEAPNPQVNALPVAPVPQHEPLPRILLQSFIDIDNDIVGLYALGHQDAEAFWAAVKQLRPSAQRNQCRIRHSWLWIYPHGIESYRHAFEELPEFQPGAQPATLVEFWE